MSELGNGQIQALSVNEIDMVGGGDFTANEAALIELALSAGAFAIGASGIGLLAIGAAAIAFSISD